MKNKVEFCVPSLFSNCALDYTLLKEKTGKEFRYASKGRYALYHILTSLQVKKGLLLPAYFCDTILYALDRIDIPYQFYDIDFRDLNPDVQSIEKKLSVTGYDAVLVPSFYGYAADLPAIELLCRKYSAKMIDDAAQSFGAIASDGRMVGTYGDGGFLAFSPGKSTMAHMGSLYWTSNQTYAYQETRHNLYHFLCYLNFLFNRQLIYSTRHIPVFSMLGFYHKLLRDEAVINDTIAKFEDKILGGCIQALFDETFCFYSSIWNSFTSRLIKQEDFRIIGNVHGQKSVQRKIVLLFQEQKRCDEVKQYLQEKGIGFFAGYRLLPGDYADIPNTMRIVNHIIELPIENHVARMEYMLNTINQLYF